MNVCAASGKTAGTGPKFSVLPGFRFSHFTDRCPVDGYQNLYMQGHVHMPRDAAGIAGWEGVNCSCEYPRLPFTDHHGNWPHLSASAAKPSRI